MRISQVCQCNTVHNVYPQKENRVNFSGLKAPEPKCMFVFDLDGTLIHIPTLTRNSVQQAKQNIEQILRIAKQRNAYIVYATGRTKSSVEYLRQQLKALNIDLPDPDYLISENGKYMYKPGIFGWFFKDKIYKRAKNTEKASGIDYLRQMLEVPYDEILIAGNDTNDLSMMELAKKGSYFICVGNATEKFKQLAAGLKEKVQNIFIAMQTGAAGILEGMRQIIKNGDKPVIID